MKRPAVIVVAEVMSTGVFIAAAVSGSWWLLLVAIFLQMQALATCAWRAVTSLQALEQRPAPTIHLEGVTFIGGST